ncbi:MAG: hypothetical protein ACXADO_03105, partial [Candidatus Thorarchaeota archaeon]
YGDLVWLTRKSARAKIEKRREERLGSPEVDKKRNIEPIRNCITCYYCSTVKTLRLVQYTKCTKEEPAWVMAKDNLSCWKSID